MSSDLERGIILKGIDTSTISKEKDKGAAQQQRSINLTSWGEQSKEEPDVADLDRELGVVERATAERDLSSTDGLINNCAEQQKISPNPSPHPIVNALLKKDEDICLIMLEEFTPDLYEPNCHYDKSNALHIAANRGHTLVVKEILGHGFPLLLKWKDVNGVRPVTVAVKKKHFTTASVLLKAMKPSYYDGIFGTPLTASSDTPKLEDENSVPEPEINLHKVMEGIDTGRRHRWNFKNKHDTDDAMMVKQNKERVEFMQAVLDTTVKEEYVDLNLLIRDDKGAVPQQFGGLAMKKIYNTLYHKIAESKCEDLISHECFATLTNHIWIDYAIVQGLLFVYNLLFMSFLTTSLVLAAKSGNPSQYNTSPLDLFRLLCEIVTLIMFITDISLEMFDLFQVVHRSPLLKDGSRDQQKTNLCIKLINAAVCEYLLNWQNILDILAILFIFLIIPFRIAESDTQWIFAALAFMFNGLRIFKYAVMFTTVGEYVAILILLIKRDVPQFLLVFIVIIFSLGGALYFSLIGHYNDDNIMDTENNNETSEVYRLWGTGFRILAEGSVLTYYGPGGFNWLGALIYWLFLFIVVVVMLNILIAQFSKSYEEETERAQINVILTKTDIILKMERSFIHRRIVMFVGKRKSTWEKTKLDRLKGFIGRRGNNKLASSEQVEKLHNQTTRLEMRLKYRLDENEEYNQELKTEVTALFKDTREELKRIKDENDTKLIGIEHAVVDTRQYVDEIKKLLLSMKKDE